MYIYACVCIYRFGASCRHFHYLFLVIWSRYYSHLYITGEALCPFKSYSNRLCMMMLSLTKTSKSQSNWEVCVVLGEIILTQ